MPNENQPEEPTEKSCLISVVVVGLIIAFFLLILYCLTNLNIKPRVVVSNESRPTLTSRQATINDIDIESDTSDLFTIELIVTPNCDIKNLEITITYYSSNDSILKTSKIYYGNVSENQSYSKLIYITDFSLSEIYKIDYVKYSVSRGTVSYFQ